MAASSESVGLNVLELYSGVGGMHCALKESLFSENSKVVCAVDINGVANSVYKLNFPDVKILQREIKHINQWELATFAFDTILMSPPCQPFTRTGLQKDSNDLRTESLFHIMEMVHKLEKKPKYILVENVKGFEHSNTRKYLVTKLIASGFHYQEFLLTPPQFGIPNSRMRYYLIAKQCDEPFCFEKTDDILHEIPKEVLHLMNLPKTPCNNQKRKRTMEADNTDELPTTKHRKTTSESPHVSESPSSSCKDQVSVDSDKKNSEIEKESGGVGEVTSDTEKVTSDTEKVTSDTEKVTSDTEKVTSDAEKVTSDTVKVTSDTEKVTSDTEKVTSDTVKVTSDTEKVSAEDTEKVSAEDTEKVSAEDTPTDNAISVEPETGEKSVNAKSSDKQDDEVTGSSPTDQNCSVKDGVDSPDENGEGTAPVSTGSQSCVLPKGECRACETSLVAYIGLEKEESVEHYLLSDKDLQYYKAIDIVSHNSKHSCCFTKRYGHYLTGSGSVIQSKENSKVSSYFRSYISSAGSFIQSKGVSNCCCSKKKENLSLEEMKNLGLRYFTPREIARLLHFPENYELTNKFTRKQLYRLFGNSLNVQVVAVMINLMVTPGEKVKCQT